MVLHFEIAQVFQNMADAKVGRVRATVQKRKSLSEAEQAEIRQHWLNQSKPVKKTWSLSSASTKR